MIGELLARLGEDLANRISGPLSLRLLLQPGVAAFLAVRAGMRHARERRPPYFQTLWTNRSQRGRLLREGLSDVAKVLGLAVALDAVYQLLVLHWIYPGEALIVALILAFVPYLLLRGVANRVARGRYRRNA